MSSYSVQAILSAKDDGFTSTFQKALSTVGGFEKSLKGGLGFGFVTGMGQAAFNLIGKGFSAITASMDSAISRVDTLNQFPKVLSLMGVESSSASKAMSILSDGIDGLPTALDEIASTAQSLTVLTGDAEKSAHAAVALNDAFLMSGSSSAEASRAMTQYSQMLAKGKVDQQSWNSLLETMGPALQKVAEGFGYTGSAARTQLYDALKSGKITFDQFQDKLIELDQACEVAGEGFDGFAAVAKQSTKGIATSMKNVRTAVTKNLANMINRADKIWQNMGSGIADHFDTMKANVNKAFSGVLNSKMFSHAMRDLGKYINSVEAGMTSMAANIGPSLDAAYPYFKKLKGGLNQIQGAATRAFTAIGEALGGDVGERIKSGLGNAFNTAIDTIVGGVTTAAGFVEKHAGLFAGAFNVISSAASGAFNWIASHLSSAVDAIASGLDTIIENAQPVVSAFQDAFSAIGESFNGFADVFPGLEGNMLSFKDICKSVSDALVDFAGFMKEHASSISSFASHLPQIGAGIVGVIAAVKGFRKAGGIISGITGLFGKFRKSGTDSMNGVTGAVGRSQGIISQVFTGLGSLITSFATSISTVLNGAASAFSTFAMGMVMALNAMSPMGMLAFVAVVATLTASLIALSYASEGLCAIIQQVGASISQVVGAIASGIASLIPVVVDGINQILPTITEGIATLVPIVTEAMAALVPVITDAITAIVPVITDFATATLPLITTGITEVVSAVTSSMAELIPVVTDSFSSMVESVSQGISSMVESVSQGVSTIAEAVTPLAEVMSETIQSIVDGATQIAGEINIPFHSELYI